MSKKITLGIVVVALLISAGNLSARDADNQPGQRPRFMGGGLPAWLDELAEAHEKNDKEKVGRLIADMKQRMESIRGMTGRPGPGGPPQGMDRPGRGMRPGSFGRTGPSSRFGGPGGIQRPGPGGPAQNLSAASLFESTPMARTEAEKKILSVLDQMDKNQRGGMMNVPAEDGRLLRLLTETVGAKHVVEIGTSNGYSGIWFCLALGKTGGRLTTHEIDAGRASLARENFKKAGVEKFITLVEGDAHEEVAKLKGPIDILFLDANKEGYIDYLDKLMPLIRPGGLVIAHNMNPRQADQRYVKAITTNPDVETILLHEQGAGVSVTLKKR